ncbi:hypothetical protein QQX98_006429 [Neonectria punicea]|uniref:Uncharacterized protein n=1 Tax=Neonectria punicea TaxID=979145 RepID=A0ABR1H0W2_9HYPO
MSSSRLPLRRRRTVRRPSRQAATQHDGADSHQDLTDSLPSPAVPRYSGTSEHYEYAGLSYTDMMAAASLSQNEWSDYVTERVRGANTAPQVDEDYEIAGTSFTDMMASASLTWDEWGDSPAPRPRKPDTAPEVAERERRPYALNLHHLYTMIQTERPKRYHVAQFLYQVNCVGDWAKHIIDYVCYKEQKFTAIWEVWQVTPDNKQWARVLFLNIQPWMQLRDVCTDMRFFHPCLH